MPKCLSKEKIYKVSPAAHIFFCLLAFNMPPSPGSGSHAPSLFSKKNYFDWKFSVILPQIRFKSTQNGSWNNTFKPSKFKYFLRCPTMVGNVNLLRYLASSLQPLNRGPCLNTSTSNSFQKRHYFFRMMRKWEEEFGVNHLIRGENWCNIWRGGSWNMPVTGFCFFNVRDSGIQRKFWRENGISNP